MLEFLRMITLISLFIFLGFYSIYFLICLYYIKKVEINKIEFSNTKYLPGVSIIIPTYNEFNVVSSKMKNLQNLNYPKDKLEIIFVDGGSDDGTADQIDRLAKNTDLSIELVRQGSRNGFNNAIIEGFSKTKEEIVIVTGAETEYDSDALNFLMRHFSNPKVGAVTGKQRIKNVKDSLSPKLEVSYRGLYDFVREAESKIDSPFDLKGEISAARRSIWESLVKNSEISNKGAIDICLSYQAIKDGLKIIYEPEAYYYELAPRSLRELFKQRIRRAAVLIQGMLIFKDMIFRKKYGAFSMLIMPAHFLMLIILPFFFLTALIGYISLLLYAPSKFLYILMMCVGILMISLSKSLQAFIQAQIALVVTSIKFLTGIETQKFERLLSARSKL